MVATDASKMVQIHWFQWNGDTYTAADRSDAATFRDGIDQVVKLVGLIDLSTIDLTYEAGSPPYLR